jgi:hypothetical protein
LAYIERSYSIQWKYGWLDIKALRRIMYEPITSNHPWE